MPLTGGNRTLRGKRRSLARERPGCRGGGVAVVSWPSCRLGVLTEGAAVTEIRTP